MSFFSKHNPQSPGHFPTAVLRLHHALSQISKKIYGVFIILIGNIPSGYCKVLHINFDACKVEFETTFRVSFSFSSNGLKLKLSLEIKKVSWLVRLSA